MSSMQEPLLEYPQKKSEIQKMLGTKAHTHNGRFSELSPEKLRGGYYTSPQIATWLAAWAIRKTTDVVLEPSCGDGVFIEAAANRLRELGGLPKSIAASLEGIEIVAEEADLARGRLLRHVGALAKNSIETGDFFSWWQDQDRLFDVVIGNPPFIRYQTFPEPHRSRAMKIMSDLGLSPNRLTNIWVPFVVASVASLKEGGRLAFVLPAELLQVSYASQLRAFLTDRFKIINIVTCNELFFQNAEQEVVLLLADGALAKTEESNICRVSLIQTPSVKEVIKKPATKLLASASPKILRHKHEKWLKYFLEEREIELMRELRASSNASMLSRHASIDVGVVTGKNEFFVLNKEKLSDLGLDEYTKPLVSRASHLHGASINEAEWKKLAEAGERVYLLHHDSLRQPKLSNRVVEYIRYGEANAVHKGYKCSIRSPWYVVPSVWTPDGFMFRQIYDFPRAVMNKANATSTDTIHRLTCKKNPERTIANLYTYLTAASAEIEGRSYGGGVLELEPTEAEKLLMPSRLDAAMSLNEADRLIRAGRLTHVLEENTRRVLRGLMGLSKSDCNLLQQIWAKLRNRRSSRRSNPIQETSA